MPNSPDASLLHSACGQRKTRMRPWGGMRVEHGAPFCARRVVLQFQLRSVIFLLINQKWWRTPIIAIACLFVVASLPKSPNEAVAFTSAPVSASIVRPDAFW